MITRGQVNFAHMVNMENHEARLVGIDWGTSSLRAWLMADAGRVLETRGEKRGMMQVENGGFARVYRALVGEWLHRYGPMPVIACGMIGSRGGWAEAGSVNVPADMIGLAQHLLRLDADPGPLHIVPGISQCGNGRLPDMMRGEETQILGALGAEPSLAEESLLVLPGTHCKWAAIESGRLERFQTYMTGELFSVLRAHSILGRPASCGAGEADRATFDLGVDTAKRANPGGLAGALFSTRSRMLVGEISAGSAAEYLSGLLIGDELRHALAGFTASPPPLRLVGDPALCARYRAALERFEIADVATIDNPAPAGLWRLAEAGGLLR